MQQVNVTVTFTIEVDDEVIPEDITTHIQDGHLSFEDEHRRVVADGTEIISHETTSVNEVEEPSA